MELFNIEYCKIQSFRIYFLNYNLLNISDMFLCVFECYKCDEVISQNQSKMFSTFSIK